MREPGDYVHNLEADYIADRRLLLQCYAVMVLLAVAGIAAILLVTR